MKKSTVIWYATLPRFVCIFTTPITVTNNCGIRQLIVGVYKSIVTKQFKKFP
jgi:hypothetical protein